LVERLVAMEENKIKRMLKQKMKVESNNENEEN
jgi:hypothetical protein